MTKTVGALIAEALGLDPTQISAHDGISIMVSNNTVSVEVTYNAKLMVDNHLELTKILKRYELVPIDEPDEDGLSPVP